MRHIWKFWNFEQILTPKMVSLTLKIVSRHFCSTLWTFWPKIRTFQKIKIFENFWPLKWSPWTLKWVSNTYVRLCVYVLSKNNISILLMPAVYTTSICTGLYGRCDRRPYMRPTAAYTAFGPRIGLDGPKTRLHYCIKCFQLKLVARIISSTVWRHVDVL